jgi:hypothetical protein
MLSMQQLRKTTTSNSTPTFMNTLPALHLSRRMHPSHLCKLWQAYSSRNHMCTANNAMYS